jgi:hypothetical protein
MGSEEGGELEVSSLRVLDGPSLHVEANVEVEGIKLSITWSEIVKDDVTSNLGKLDVLRPAKSVRLIIR